MGRKLEGRKEGRKGKVSDMVRVCMWGCGVGGLVASRFFRGR